MKPVTMLKFALAASALSLTSIASAAPVCTKLPPANTNLQ
jgi:hypothetical protein